MKLKIVVIAIILVLISACSDADFDLEDTVAILNGEEIKLEEILWQFSLDKNRQDKIIAYLKQEIIILEAKKMGITVTKEEIEENKQALYPGSDASERYEHAEDKEFHQTQALLLDISPEEYYKGREDRVFRTQAYIDKYIDTKFGYPEEGEDVDEWGETINDYIDKLFEEYKEEGKLILK